MLDFYFFNVGHGDSIAINFPNNSWGIIDCNRNINEKDPQVLTFLRRKNIEILKFICITHPHADHYKGIDIILKHYKSNIEKFILYGLTNNDKERDKTTSLGKTIIEFAELNKKQLNEKFVLVESGQSYDIEDVNIMCLNPSNKILNNFRKRQILNASNIEYNDVSIVFKINYKNKTVLLTGDSSSKNWNEILKNENNYFADLIKISHHGSKENNTEKLLENILKKESFAIISTDGGIKYPTIPSTEVIDYIENKCQSTVLKTSNLYKDIVNNQIEKINNSDIVDAVLEETSSNIKGNKFDGVIKISITENGEIVKNTYKTLDEYFDS